MENKKTQLLELIKKEAVFKGNFVLASGKESNYYIDLRLVTLNPEGAYLIADILFDLLKNERIDAIGGLTMGADPICGAFSAISYLKGKPIPSFIVRKEEKKYGKTRSIEGPLKKGSKVVIIDDVATTGKSLIKAINAVKKEECEIVGVMAIVDRCEGANEILKDKGYTLISLFNIQDLGVE